MTLKFASFVNLLQSLEATRIHCATTEGRATNPDHRIIKDWFATHGHEIPRHGPAALALLSCFLPERLPQRVYGLREVKLTKIFGRALGLRRDRLIRLKGWEHQRGRLDFAEHVAEIMAEAETSSNRQLTLEDVDDVLVQVAASSGFSGPRVKALRHNDLEAHDLLSPVILSIKSCEAKWLIRLILKDFKTFQMPEKVLLTQFHFLLPDIINLQPDLEAAVAFLGHEKLKAWPCNPDVGSAKALKAVAAALFEPQMGVMLARQPYDKARSIKHCIKLADKQVMSVERKYDGEYCQIHVTRTAEKDITQIFSKSGKDSTADRDVLHRAIATGLKLDGEQCKIQHRCILEGELLIWNQSKGDIEPFHKIRRYVKHGGRFLGIDRDSPRKHDEHVMIMFYDILMLDERVLASRAHEERRRYLKDVVKRIPGTSDIGSRKLIDFSKPSDGSRRLRAMFTTSIRQGWEGLVLKSQNNPYYSWTKSCRGIKLKKDYLQQLGDTADLCIIGARRDPRLGDSDGWNTFYMACLDNKENVSRFGASPSFKVIDTILAGTSCIPPADLIDLNRLGQGRGKSWCDEASRDIQFMTTLPPPTVLFDPPFVVECLGSGYDKSSNCNFWTLRFPRLTKIHYDRGPAETLSFRELQEAAQKPSHAEADDDDVQAIIRKLIAADGKRPAQTGSTQSTSPSKTPRSATTASISPVASRRPPPPPFFVRADSNELDAVELQHRRGHSQATSSTRTPSSAASKRSTTSILHQPHDQKNPTGVLKGLVGKRAKLQQPTVVAARPHQKRQLESPPPSSPTPASNGKRRAVEHVSRDQDHEMRPYRLIQSQQAPPLEIDLTQSSPSASPGPSRATVMQCRATMQQPKARKARGLTTTPPWCVAPSKPSLPEPSLDPWKGHDPYAAIPPRMMSLDGCADSPKRVLKASRLPLSDLPPESPQHSLSSARGERKSVDESGLRPDHRKSDISVLREPDVFDLREESEASLLTPPGTEEAARRLDQAKRAAETARPQGASSPENTNENTSKVRPAVSDGSDALRTASFDASPTAAPMLLSRTLPDHGRVQRLLSRSTETFTYSHKSFLAAAFARPAKRHIMLVDSADHAATAKEVWALGSHAVEMLKASKDGALDPNVPREKQANIRLDFFDWRVLQDLVARSARRGDKQGGPDEVNWKQHFCCAIDVGGDVTDDKGNAAGWIVWR